jgi:signal transduction histidine kinase
VAILVVLAIFLTVLLLIYGKNVRQKNLFNEELKQKNKTILEQNDLISRRNKELDELNKTKVRLFSILSHDLRSPIGSIEQILQMIKEGDFSDEEKIDLLDEMLVQVSGTSQMLHNLLHWANSQMDGDRVNFEDVSLPNKIEKVLGAHYFAINNKGITLTHVVPQNLPQITADIGQLSVILHNLLSNAIKYTREGKEIKITYLERAEKVLLKIKDGGEGISPGKIREIMSFSTRLSSEVGTRMEMGTGLGLLLVKQFLQLNKAEMEIDSYPGEGAEFTISFLKSTKANN